MKDNMVNGIEKIIYENEAMEVMTGKVRRRDKYIITPDGILEHIHTSREAENAPLKTRNMGKWQGDRDKTIALYSDIIDCMRNAADVLEYIDDSSAELKIVYGMGEIILPRGLQSKDKTINDIMESFLSAFEGAKI